MRIRADDVFENLGNDETIALELTYGNSEKIALQRILDKAGPFTVKTPWTLEDNNGQTLIHAGGFSAMPLGEQHPKLINFVKEYFEKNKEVVQKL